MKTVADRGMLGDRLFEYEFSFFKQIVRETAAEKIFESVPDVDGPASMVVIGDGPYHKQDLQP